MNKVLCLFIALAASQSDANQDFFVPKHIVNEWGYKITERNGYPYIKRIKKIPGGGPAYYPSFYLSEECFSSKSEAAMKETEILKELSAESGSFKRYLNVFTHKKCLYRVSTDSNLFYLEFQAGIVDKLKRYVSTK